jgi:hypothetical protein
VTSSNKRKREERREERSFLSLSLIVHPNKISFFFVEKSELHLAQPLERMMMEMDMDEWMDGWKSEAVYSEKGEEDHDGYLQYTMNLIWGYENLLSGVSMIAREQVVIAREQHRIYCCSRATIIEFIAREQSVAREQQFIRCCSRAIIIELIVAREQPALN